MWCSVAHYRRLGILSAWALKALFHHSFRLTLQYIMMVQPQHTLTHNLVRCMFPLNFPISDSRFVPIRFHLHRLTAEFHYRPPKMTFFPNWSQLNSVRLHVRVGSYKTSLMKEGLTSNWRVKYEHEDRNAGYWIWRPLHSLCLREWFRFIAEAWTLLRNPLIHPAITP